MLYDSGERSASALYYFATRRVPGAMAKLYKTEDIIPWVENVGNVVGLLARLTNSTTDSGEETDSTSY
jgi:hypothetical protein